VPDPLLLAQHFDGCCWPNPGGAAAYGWHVDVLDAGAARPFAEGHGPVTDPDATGNLAEWRALEAGLCWLAHLTVPVGRLRIFGDSQLVVHQLTGRWKCKTARLAAIRDECQRLLGRLAAWDAFWVPRGRNERADGLAAEVIGTTPQTRRRIHTP
jgi:ribonuclease HI